MDYGATSKENKQRSGRSVPRTEDYDGLEIFILFLSCVSSEVIAKAGPSRSNLWQEIDGSKMSRRSPVLGGKKSLILNEV